LFCEVGLLSLAETRKPDEKKWKERDEGFIGIGEGMMK